MSVVSPAGASGDGSGRLGGCSGTDTLALGGFSALGLVCALGGGSFFDDLIADRLGKPFGMVGMPGIDPCTITGAAPGLGAPAAAAGAVAGVGAPTAEGAALGFVGASPVVGGALSVGTGADSASPKSCLLLSSKSISISPLPVSPLPFVLACCSCLLISPAAAVASSFAFE